MKNFFKRCSAFFCVAVISCIAVCFTFTACEEEKNEEPATLTGIEIIVEPDKTVYDIGEIFDPSGMVVKAYYSDDSESLVEDFTCEHTEPLVQTDNFVRIRYEDKVARQKITVLARGNSKIYSVEQTETLSNSPLKGKIFYFLGSSVTLGSASLNESMADFIAKRNECTAVKEAVSGTTLCDDDETSYVQRIKNLNVNGKPDAFICQLSTNDAKYEDRLGEISESFKLDDFDKSTTCGAIEYIIAYAKEKWDCKIIFYTNSYYYNSTYKSMVEALYQIVLKWDIDIIDLYNDTEFNSITKSQKELYKYDNIHPTRAGYREWWTPVFEKRLEDIVQG